MNRQKLGCNHPWVENKEKLKKIPWLYDTNSASELILKDLKKWTQIIFLKKICLKSRAIQKRQRSVSDGSFPKRPQWPGQSQGHESLPFMLSSAVFSCMFARSWIGNGTGGCWMSTALGFWHPLCHNIGSCKSHFKNLYPWYILNPARHSSNEDKMLKNKTR